MGDGGLVTGLIVDALVNEVTDEDPPSAPNLRKIDEQDDEETTESKRRARERRQRQRLAQFGSDDTLLAGAGGGLGTASAPSAGRVAPTLGGG